MLNLPADWQSYCPEYIVVQLMLQAEAKRMYGAAARAMTRASLDFMLSGPRWPDRPASRRLLPLPHLSGWNIEDWLFYVMPSVDDEAMQDVAALKGSRWQVDLLAPPWAKQVVQHAVKAILPRFPITVYGLETYVGLRIALTGLDIRVLQSRGSSAEFLVDLLHRYAHIVRETPEISIDLDMLAHP